jgi:hypothetical protein
MPSFHGVKRMQTSGFAPWILHQAIPSSARKKNGQYRIVLPSTETQ